MVISKSMKRPSALAWNETLRSSVQMRRPSGAKEAILGPDHSGGSLGEIDFAVNDGAAFVFRERPASPVPSFQKSTLLM